MTCRRRYKIEKKVREHHKKLKKLGRKSDQKKPKSKDPGIPSMLPFKDAVLAEIQKNKVHEAERRELIREAFVKKQKQGRDGQLDKLRGINTTTGDLATLAKNAEKRAKEFSKTNPDLGTGKGGSVAGVSNLRTYYKEFQKVVETADVILQVVDARDPIGTRCPEVEQAVLAAGADKRLVILLNKVDLIPRENLQAWLAYLRNEFPTIAFKASTQMQKHNLGRSSKNILDSSSDLLSSSKCLGAKMLMKLLGNYCRSEGIKTAIRVGVVGFPNVGKSSVINSLKRNRSCGVGATPGLTKTAQEVSLDKHIKLIDSPGIVFAKLNQFNEFGNEEGSRLITSLMALRNATKVETLEDPITPVEAILSRVRKDDLLLFYRLPDFKDCEEFLGLLAARIGKLKKGGVPNRMAAARKILTDWNSGKIKYFTVPPEVHTLPSHISAEIVSSLSAGFKFGEDLVEEEMAELDAGISSKVTTGLCVPSLGFLKAEDGMIAGTTTSETMDSDLAEAKESDDDECEDMAVDDTKSILSNATHIQLRPRKNRSTVGGVDVEMKEKAADSKLMSGMQLNRAKKVQFKKEKKQKKRNSKVTDKLASSFGQDVVLGDYDFETDFAK